MRPVLPAVAVVTRAAALGALAAGAVLGVMSGPALGAPLGAQVPGAAPAARPPTAVRSRVVDAATGAPLAGAELWLVGVLPAAPNGDAAAPRDTAAVRTDARGAWHAAVAPGRYRVRARALGYLPRERTVDLGPGAADLVLALDAVALPLGQVVVSAARREQRLADAVVTTEVVTRAEIARTGASDLASVLLEQTGTQLQGGMPAGAGAVLQGLGDERVLVLLDGRPVAGRIAGVFDLSRIPTAVIERVEVIKGPQATLYGTDAMGGVINIVTRTPGVGSDGVWGPIAGATATVTAGSQARRDGGAGLTLARGALAGTVDVGRRTIDLTPGRGATDGALAARTDGAAKLRWAPDSLRSVEASVLALDERQRWRSGALYTFSDNRQWSGRLTGAWRRGRQRLVPTLYASTFDHRSRGSVATRPIAGDTGQRDLQRVSQADVQYTGQFGAAGAHVVDAGAQLRRDETEAARVPGGLRAVTTVEPYVQAELAATPALSLAPGVRLSRSAQWGTAVTPRLAARYVVPLGAGAGGRLTLRASAGTGFRAPGFKELFMFFQNQAAGYAVLGNPDLRPERSRNVTGGAEWAADRAYLRGQLFWNGFRNFIETRPIQGAGEAPLYRYANVSTGSTRGVEAEVGGVLGRVRLESGYAALATRDNATGRPLLGRPTHSGRLAASYAAPAGGRLAGARLSTVGVFTGRTPMQRGDDGQVTSWRDAFLRVDLRAAQRVRGGLDLVIGADNLFDTRPAQWAGFTGRQLYTALSWTLAPTAVP